MDDLTTLNNYLIHVKKNKNKTKTLDSEKLVKQNKHLLKYFFPFLFLFSYTRSEKKKNAKGKFFFSEEMSHSE